MAANRTREGEKERYMTERFGRCVAQGVLAANDAGPVPGPDSMRSTVLPSGSEVSPLR
jgi:hypothetical protein